MPTFLITFTDDEAATVARWREHYLSADMPNTIEGAVRDMLRRLMDDMNEMEEAPADA